MDLKLELIDVEFVFVVAFQQFAYFCEFPLKSYICSSIFEKMHLHKHKGLNRLLY